MKLNNDYKNDALSALRGRWPSAVLAMLVYFVLAIVLMIPFMLYSVKVELDPANMSLAKVFLLVYFLTILLYVFVLGPVLIGLVVSCKKLLLHRDDAVIGNMFRFAFGRLGRNALAFFLRTLFISLWSILLFVPGIIKSLSYAMTYYILDDEPELSANQAINLSMRMMKGHKFDLFYLYLSFAGWFILGMLSLGIGFLFLYPYIQCAQASFYQDVKADYLARINSNGDAGTSKPAAAPASAPAPVQPAAPAAPSKPRVENDEDYMPR
jgi:Predicted integral membrane protein